MRESLIKGSDNRLMSLILPIATGENTEICRGTRGGKRTEEKKEETGENGINGVEYK